MYGLSGAVVGAVDLVRGIGRYAGMDVIDVPGATGDLDTDYGAKARAALAALAGHDLVWVHVEAPDEASHMGSLAEKLRAIERVDAEVLAPLVAAPERPAVLVLPDHYTPLRTRTHDDTPVPFVLAPGGGAASAGPAAPAYSEVGRGGHGAAGAGRPRADAAVPRSHRVRTVRAAAPRRPSQPKADRWPVHDRHALIP